MEIVPGIMICMVFKVLVRVKLHQVIGNILQIDNDKCTIASQAVSPAKYLAISFLFIFILSDIIYRCFIGYIADEAFMIFQKGE